METFAILPSETGKTDQIITSYTQTEPVEDLLYEFLRDRTPTTAASYRDDLKPFFDFTSKYFQIPRAEGNGVHFEDIKRVHIVKYKNFLESEPNHRGKPYAPNSVNRKISSISAFYQFLLRRELIDKNPAEFSALGPRESLFVRLRPSQIVK